MIHNFILLKKNMLKFAHRSLRRSKNVDNIPKIESLVTFYVTL